MRGTRLLLAGLLLVGVAGCSWLVGVSDDPVVSLSPLPADAADAGEDAAEDAPKDAPKDVEVE